MTARPDQTDVMLALLAFDAYNRGSNTQLRYSSDEKDKLATTFGGAKLEIVSDGVLPPAATSIGFSASSYTFDGKTVISYRGTDFNFNSVDEGIQTLRDPLPFRHTPSRLLNSSSPHWRVVLAQGL